MRRENFSYILRAVAGGYLFYLAYQLIRGSLNGQNEGMVPIIAGIVFGVVAVGCFFSIINGIIKSRMPQESEIEKQFDKEQEVQEQEEKIEE